MRAKGPFALRRPGNHGKGEINVISGGESGLKGCKSARPQLAMHILDGFHIAMKPRPIERTAKRLARRLPPDEREEFREDVAAVS